MKSESQRAKSQKNQSKNIEELKNIKNALIDIK